MDAVSNFLIERGSPGVVIKRNEIQAYFVHSLDDALIRADIQRFLGGLNGVYAEEPRLRWRLLKDRNWNSSWRRFFSPQRVGKAFWVTPPWLTRPPIRHRHVITIDPGMAFGTGTHATTRGCMEFIEKAAAVFRGTEFSALDVGTGSGILAIALAKLGAAAVWAVDADPVALKVARENLRCNHVQERIHLTRVKLSGIRKSFPLVVANLTAETIIDLSAVLEKRVAHRGFLILSGILHPKTQKVTRSFAADFKVVKCKREKEWVTLMLRRQ
jgi:ribosomal protein L11 methyltransferase